MNEVNTIEVIQETVDLAEVELLLQQNNEMLQSIYEQMNNTVVLQQASYTALLWVISVCGAAAVLLLLYKFIKLFY